MPPFAILWPVVPKLLKDRPLPNSKLMECRDSITCRMPCPSCSEQHQSTGNSHNKCIVKCLLLVLLYQYESENRYVGYAVLDNLQMFH